MFEGILEEQTGSSFSLNIRSPRTIGKNENKSAFVRNFLLFALFGKKQLPEPRLVLFVRLLIAAQYKNGMSQEVWQHRLTHSNAVR
jgi:hypothetical protein